LYVGGVEKGLDIAASGLLDGLDGEARRDRAELIVWLLDRGFSADQIRASVAPFLLPADRVLGDDGQYVSARQICESTGVDVEVLQRLHGEIGLPRFDDPDAPVLLRADAQAAARAKFFIDMGVDLEETIAVMRALVESLRHVAAMMRETALKTLLRPGGTELELAQATEELARKTVPQFGPMMDDLLRLLFRRSMEVEAVNAAERAAGTLPGARQVTVAFADLAGFTQLGESLPPEELHHLANRLAELARDAAIPPVRFIKSIGDAVMFVSPDPVPLIGAALALIAAAEARGLPPLRIGIASGGAVSRSGDWFGSPVNVASRVTAEARPGTVLVGESAHNEAGDTSGFHWSSVGTRRLKGVSGGVKLFRVQRAFADGI
jgi:adenylate cyclase